MSRYHRMLLNRKVLIAAIAIVSLFLLFRHTVTPPSPAPITQENKDKSEDRLSSSRSYPPSRSDGKGKHEQQILHNISSRPLRKQLEYYYPYDVESKFPAFIWQTWRNNPAQKEFEERLRPLEATWTELHPAFVHEVVVDDAANQLINYLYASVPQVTQAWDAMPVAVLKADFFRYLILLARGGIYSDIDTAALKPAVEWLPAGSDSSSLGLVVGIEADPDRQDWNKWYARRIQFCQWTIQSKAGHPILREIVARITEATLDMKSKGQLHPGKEPVSKSVMEFTGPGIWTDTIFAYFNDRDYFDYSSRSHNVTVEDFFNIKKQKVIGDVVVLPITSFSPGVGQMGAGGTDDPLAFVHHEFEGSWKPAKERHVGG